MSQQKAQLINATENVTIPGGIDISGVATAGLFIGSFSGTATRLSGAPNLNVGIVTATLYGNGSNLTGVGSSAFIGVVTAAQSGTTTIDLSLGNVIYFTQDTNTTVAFANTEAVQKLKFIRVKDDTTDARTITWPSSIIWNGGSAPTLVSGGGTNAQIFDLTTRDQGVTWYGYESQQTEIITTGVSLYMVGSNDQGGLGLNNLVQYSSPVQVPGSWTGFSMGQTNSVATKSDGTLWVWGNNESGNLGINNRIYRSSPVQLPGTQWDLNPSGRDVKVAYNINQNGFFIKTDGTLWSAGNNAQGVLGHNDLVNYSSPAQIPGTQWKHIGPTRDNVSFVKTDGTLWYCGTNSGYNSGQAGLNDLTPRSSPAQIPGTQWKQSMGGWGTMFATKTDGTLWAWGNPSKLGVYYGMLGLNNNTIRQSPTQLPGTQWVEVKSMAYDAFALKDDGTLWAWGGNRDGQLGQNSKTSYSSPTQIPGTNWEVTHFEASRQGIFITKTDGTMWTWGQGGGGSLAQNNTVTYSSPVQIPGTDWVDTSSGNNNFGYIR